MIVKDADVLGKQEFNLWAFALSIAEANAALTLGTVRFRLNEVWSTSAWTGDKDPEVQAKLRDNYGYVSLEDHAQELP